MEEKPAAASGAPPDLIGDFALEVADAEGARALAGQVLEVLVEVLGGRGAVLLSLHGGEPALVASCSAGEVAVATAAAVWARGRAALEEGEPFCVTARSGDARLEGAEREGPEAFVLVPVFHPEWLGLVLTGRQLLGLLYAEGDDAALCGAASLERLQRYARILARPLLELKAQASASAEAAPDTTTTPERHGDTEG